MLDNYIISRNLYIHKKRAILFLSLQLFFVFLVTFPLFINHVKSDSSQVISTSVIFMMTPMLSALITRRITEDKSYFYLKIYFKEHLNLYLAASFCPGTLITIGTIIYFIIFPHQFDQDHIYLENLLKEYEKEIFLPHFTPIILIGISLSCIFISPLIFVNHIAVFGEEIGWRCYFLPLMIDLYGKKKAVIISGLLWGIFHVPLVFFGLNYPENYVWSPWSGILMMIFFAFVLNIPLSYLTLKTRSVFPACIFHGAFNAIREVPLLLCKPDFNPLVGPKPSGLIGMIGFIVIDIFIFQKM